MKNLKNKKRLANVVVAFILAFVVGAGFAAVPGVLDVEGGMHLAVEEYATWSRVETDTLNAASLIMPLGWDNDGASQEVAIVDGDNGRTSQRIEWNVYFAEEGSVAISAYVENHSTVPMLLTTVEYEWTFEVEDLDAEDFGLEVFIDDEFIAAPFELAPGVEHFAPVLIGVAWDGTFPTLDPADFDELEIIEGPTEDEYVFVGTLVVYFDYVPVP